MNKFSIEETDGLIDFRLDNEFLGEVLDNLYGWQHVCWFRESLQNDFIEQLGDAIDDYCEKYKDNDKTKPIIEYIDFIKKYGEITDIIDTEDDELIEKHDELQEKAIKAVIHISSNALVDTINVFVKTDVWGDVLHFVLIKAARR